MQHGFGFFMPIGKHVAARLRGEPLRLDFMHARVRHLDEAGKARDQLAQVTQDHGRVVLGRAAAGQLAQALAEFAQRPHFALEQEMEQRREQKNRQGEHRGEGKLVRADSRRGGIEKAETDVAGDFAVVEHRPVELADRAAIARGY